ncbi:protein FAM161B [Chanos chanos]|uniref:Protein FAM161B n=1 Tax=Chanos chanos TaxID=29144 RepID=A0A6J2WFY5_CHACN|nr:protein FAM161B [Chanos chanos]
MDEMTMAFPPLDGSQPDEDINGEGKAKIPENLEDFLKGVEGSQKFFEISLESLKATHRQQLQETGLQHHRNLEKRLLQNSLLSTVDRRTDTKEIDGHHWENIISKKKEDLVRYNGPRRSSSVPDVASEVREQSQSRRSKTSASNTVGSVFFGMTMQETQSRSNFFCTRESKPSSSSFVREQTDMEECQKQFRAAPVPEHVSKALYENITKEQERKRKEGHEQRRNFLLSIQKPFTFMQREEKSKERPTQDQGPTNQHEKDKPCVTRKPIPKAVIDKGVSEHLKEEEVCRKIRIQTRARESLSASSAPTLSQQTRTSQERRSAQMTKSRMLAYLDQKPSFQPATNAQVPDFKRLYQAFQRDVVKRAGRKDVTHCQPFQLRTSVLRPRQSRNNPEEPLKSTNTNLKRSTSFAGLTSLSMDTLPTYITDAARKRRVAIRRSLEQREDKERESAEWMRRHRMNSEAMRRAVTVRAKAMDPHRSLKEVYQEKLKQHREADQQRVREYKEELREMKARVTGRPYLFEQLSQKNAKSDAERRYRDTLKQAGLNENFVKTKGEEAVKTITLESDAEDDDDGNSDVCSTENDLQNR